MAQQPPMRVERRLSAILAADVAGYSRLMHNDEEATHARLTMLLADAVEPSIAQHGGRVVKNTGDGLLAEFRSAVEALRAATQFQERVHDLTIGDPDEKRLAFRVGINIGDVIVEPHDIFGDGVNVAARLEGIAKPGSICISASTYEQVVGKVAIEFTDLGEQSLKNIARPVRAYAVVPKESAGATRTGGETPGPHSVRRLSIVVLPFANLGGDPEQDYFVDGITESLTTDLSRINGSFVIARNTAFTFKGKAMDVQKLGRELNVRYLLEGSVQRGGNRLRVNVQLIDVETGNHLWAERFDKPIADLFDMQDEIVSSLANALNAQLIEAEARRAERSLRPDAMDLSFQGSSCWNKGMTAEQMAQARGFFERALTLDPGNMEALVGMAAVDVASAAFFIVSDREARFAAAEATLIKALSMSPQHARAHMFLGAVQNLNETCGPRHSGMRAGVGAGSKLGRRPWFDRLREGPYRSTRGSRGPHPGSLSALSPRYRCLSVDALCCPCQDGSWRRRRSGFMATPVSRGEPKLSPRAFPTRRRACAARLIGGGAGCSTGGACAPSSFHYSPHARRQNE